MRTGDLSQDPEDAREDGEEDSDGTLAEEAEEEDLRGVVILAPRLGVE